MKATAMANSNDYSTEDTSNASNNVWYFLRNGIALLIATIFILLNFCFPLRYTIVDKWALPSYINEAIKFGSYESSIGFSLSIALFYFT